MYVHGGLYVDIAGLIRAIKRGRCGGGVRSLIHSCIYSNTCGPRSPLRPDLLDHITQVSCSRPALELILDQSPSAACARLCACARMLYARSVG